MKPIEWAIVILISLGWVFLFSLALHNKWAEDTSIRLVDPTEHITFIYPKVVSWSNNGTITAEIDTQLLEEGKSYWIIIKR